MGKEAIAIALTQALTANMQFDEVSKENIEVIFKAYQIFLGLLETKPNL